MSLYITQESTINKPHKLIDPAIISCTYIKITNPNRQTIDEARIEA